jgi:phosphatidylserine/phosphatidylglycerophosphate/cardiolipin synthase-like enzyme
MTNAANLLYRRFTVPLPVVWGRVGALLLACWLTGCAGLPPRPASLPSAAIADYAQTPVAAIIATALPGDGRSGFQLLPFGPNAYATRLELARLATRSLDVQYYLLQGDHAGRRLMRALRDAAVRGVRVRVLLDDLYTTGEDELLLGLAAHPNVQVRLFNPFPAGRSHVTTRFLSSAFDLARVDRRMHNKLFVADNAAAVAGGRNIGDEYVMNAPGAANFVDMDVFAAGPVVRDLSRSFDHYWNSDVVFDVRSIASSPLSPRQLRQRFDEQTANTRAPQTLEMPFVQTYVSEGYPTREQLPEGIAPMLNLPFELARGRISPLVPAHARVLFDPLSKTAGQNERDNSITGTVLEGAIQWLQTARQHVKMVSPYFVPSDSAVASMAYARGAGVGVDIVTNSLAATDEPWVYVGYARRVKDLLAMGVNIKELSPTLSVKRKKMGIFGSRSTGALHMKSAMVDHAQVFLGSMNLDPRSARLNTELGIIIDSVELARQLDNLNDPGSVYTLRLGPGGDVQWLEHDDDGHDIVHDVPPETSAWLRFKLRVLGPFIPEREL